MLMFPWGMIYFISFIALFITVKNKKQSILQSLYLFFKYNMFSKNYPASKTSILWLEEASISICQIMICVPHYIYFIENIPQITYFKLFSLGIPQQCSGQYSVFTAKGVCKSLVGGTKIPQAALCGTPKIILVFIFLHIQSYYPQLNCLLCSVLYMNKKYAHYCFKITFNSYIMEIQKRCLQISFCKMGSYTPFLHACRCFLSYIQETMGNKI